MSDRDIYKFYQQDFKKGDKVRITRKAKNGEKGWNNVWIDEDMDKAIGQIHKVEAPEGGCSGVLITLGSYCYGFPSFVLEKVDE